MQCARTLCQECATQWDGIWYCAGCLTSRRNAPAAKAHIGGWIAVIAASLCLLFLGTRFMVWSGVLLAGLR
jgi:hypothetical protein